MKFDRNGVVLWLLMVCPVPIMAEGLVFGAEWGREDETLADYERRSEDLSGVFPDREPYDTEGMTEILNRFSDAVGLARSPVAERAAAAAATPAAEASRAKASEENADKAEEAAQASNDKEARSRFENLRRQCERSLAAKWQAESYAAAVNTVLGLPISDALTDSPVPGDEELAKLDRAGVVLVRHEEWNAALASLAKAQTNLDYLAKTKKGALGFLLTVGTPLAAVRLQYMTAARRLLDAQASLLASTQVSDGHANMDQALRIASRRVQLDVLRQAFHKQKKTAQLIDKQLDAFRANAVGTAQKVRSGAATANGAGNVTLFSRYTALAAKREKVMRDLTWLETRFRHFLALSGGQL